MIRHFAIAFVLANSVWTCAAFAGTRHALLVGVSRYNETVATMAPQLAGPPNDVALMTSTLLDMGFDEDKLTILTDGPERLPEDLASPEPPTRQNILTALDALAGNAAQGDDILVYLSGHGAQIPAATTDDEEPDGLNEIFLPADFMYRDGAYHNAILDNEIGARIDRMMAAGATVWLLADTCHSGSLRRSAGREARPRLARLDAISSPQQSLLSDEIPLGAVTTARERVGEFIGFYAAEAGALAYEERKDGEVHGLLTWSVVRAIRRGSAQSFGDLAREVTGLLWREAPGKASPLFVGALNRSHFANRDNTTERGRTYSLQFGAAPKVSAGRIDGLVRGTRIAIGRRLGETLLEATVTTADLASSAIALHAFATPSLDAAIASEGLDPARFRDRWLQDRASDLVAWVVDRPVEFDLSIALPPQDTVPPPLLKALTKSLSELAPRVRITTAETDVTIEATSARLYLRPTDPVTEQHLSVPATVEALPEFRKKIERIARFRALANVADGLSDTAFSKGLFAHVSVFEGTREASGRCRQWPSGQLPQRTPQRWPQEVGDCDLVEISISNQNSDAMDVTPLYIAPDHRVYFLGGYDGSNWGGLRIPPGTSGEVRYIETTAAPDGQSLATGPMSILLLAIKSDLQKPPRDFRYLQDEAPPPRERSETGGSLETLLETAGYGVQLRSGGTADARVDSAAMLIPLRTQAERTR